VTVDSAPPTKRGLPRWAIVLIAVGGAIAVTVIGLVIAVIVSVFSGPAWGPTEAAALQPGSCLAEKGADLAVYTVVDCDQPHPQQVFAEIDLSRNTAQYTTQTALTTYAGEICARFLEYGLFVTEAADDTVTTGPLAVPTPEALAAGSSRALCSLSGADGSSLTGDLYRPMP